MKIKRKPIATRCGEQLLAAILIYPLLGLFWAHEGWLVLRYRLWHNKRA